MDPKSRLLSYTPLGEISGFSRGFFKTAGSQAPSRFAILISNVITVLTIFGGLAFFFWFVIGALSWTTSGGDPEKLTKAKSQMSAAVAGLFILILSYAIIFILGKITGLNILNLENLIKRLKP